MRTVMVTGSHNPDDRASLTFFTAPGQIAKRHEAAILEAFSHRPMLPGQAEAHPLVAALPRAFLGHRQNPAPVRPAQAKPQDLSLRANLSRGVHHIAIDFPNDLHEGLGRDRNLNLAGLEIDGVERDNVDNLAAGGVHTDLIQEP